MIDPMHRSTTNQSSGSHSRSKNKELHRMQNVQRAVPATGLTTASRWCRGVVGAVTLCALSIAGLSTAAGAENSKVMQAPSGGEVANVTPAPINGNGSSFASPAIETWTHDVGQAPYNVSVNWSVSNSGQGRYTFTNQTTDFAVSDIGYVGNTDTTPPSFAFNFIPITAGGIAFMYHVPGLTKQLQLSSLTACGLLTGGIKNWNDPNIAADNPGVSLPNLPVIPVTESDSAGTNYVLEEWCIAEQPAFGRPSCSSSSPSRAGPPTAWPSRPPRPTRTGPASRAVLTTRPPRPWPATWPITGERSGRCR